MEIPDHPIIRNCERYGYPDGEEEEEEIICPICLKESEEFYEDKDGEIVGCDRCIKRYDAWEWMNEHEGGRI